MTGILEAHRNPDLADSPYTTGTADDALVKFDVARIQALTAFLKALRLDLPASTIAAALEAKRAP